MLQNALFIIIGLSIIIFTGWMARGFFMAAEISIFIRIVAGVGTVGVVALLGLVIRDRIKQAKEENFKEVDK